MADIYDTVSVVQTQELNAQQHLVDAVKVVFVSKDGKITGDVSVPLTSTWGTAADTAIRAFLAQAETIL